MARLLVKLLELLGGLLATQASRQALIEAGAPPDTQMLGVETLRFGSSYDRQAEELRKRSDICDFVASQVGKPYHLGVEVPTTDDSPAEWDCSELTENAYRRAGIELPDGSNYQYDFCRPVNEPQGGDLGFVWSESWGRIGHVVVYMGDGSCVEARGKPASRVQRIARADWEQHPRWRGWRRHPDFMRPKEDRA